MRNVIMILNDTDEFRALHFHNPTHITLKHNVISKTIIQVHEFYIKN